MGQLVDRVGALLNAFTPQDPHLGLAECASRAGLTKSSTHRLLVSLAEIGMLERDGLGNWQIGELPLRLAAIRLSHTNMRQEANRTLRVLGEKYLAATAFSVPNGNRMVYVERTESVLPFTPAAQLGSTAPMWAGAAGHAVLSQLTPAERLARCESDEWTAMPKEVRGKIMSEIEAAATRGYSVDRGDFHDGVAGVAASLGRPGEPVAALSLIISPERMSAELERQMGQDISQLADEITRKSTMPTFKE